MGFEVTRFISEIDEEFLCSICTMVFEDPVHTPCDHSFCDKCIQEWLSINSTCPVDRKPLTITCLKQPGRFFRNLLAKLEIHCDFQSKCCHAVVKLEHLQDHLLSCEYNPESEIICDRGCNIKIRRREYEADDCFTHLANRVSRQEKEIVELRHQLTELKEHYEGIVSREQVEKMKFKEEVGRLQEQILELNSKSKSSFGYIAQATSNLNKISNSIPKWQKFVNMKYTAQQPDVLENSGIFYDSFAQSFRSLEQMNSRFKVEILNKGVNNWICVGLTSKKHSNFEKPGHLKESVGYFSDGDLFIDRKREKLPYNVGFCWEVGDIIECGIKFPTNFIFDQNRNAAVYFVRNGQLIAEKLIQIPRDGFFPTINMWGPSNKVKYYLTN